MVKKRRKKDSLDWNKLLPWLILAGIVLYLGNIGAFDKVGGWFTNSTTYIKESTIIDWLNQAPGNPSDAECTIEINPATMNSGGVATGTITDGILTECTVYANFNDLGWYEVYTGTTDIEGELTHSQVITTPGTFKFVAICGDCVTNKDTLKVVLVDDGSGGDGGTQPTCDFLCQNAGWDAGNDAVDSQCDIGTFYVDNYGNECCCWNDGSQGLPVCSSAWPVPSSQDDCWERPGCDANVCVFVDAGIAGQNYCQCEVLDDCDTYCRYEGYSRGYCNAFITKNPCGDNVHELNGDQYCGSGLLPTCCCEV